MQEQKTSAGVEEPAQGQLKIDLQVAGGPAGPMQLNTANNSMPNGSVVNTPTEIISSPIQNVPLAINGIQLIYQQPQQIHQLPAAAPPTSTASAAGNQCVVGQQIINQNGTQMPQLQQSVVHPNMPQQTPLNAHPNMVNPIQQQPPQQPMPLQPIQQPPNQMPLMPPQQQPILIQQSQPQQQQQGSQQFNPALPPQQQFLQTQPNQLHQLPPQVVSIAQAMTHQLAPMQSMAAQQQIISQQQQQLQMQMPPQSVPGMYNQQAGARVATPQNFHGAVPNHLLQQAPLMATQQPGQPMQHVMQPLFNAAAGEGDCNFFRSLKIRVNLISKTLSTVTEEPVSLAATHPHLLPSDIQSVSYILLST